MTGEFGTYSTAYRQDGRVLSVVRREVSGSGVYRPSRFDDVIAFYRSISRDEENRTIVIDKGTSR